VIVHVKADMATKIKLEDREQTMAIKRPIIGKSSSRTLLKLHPIHLRTFRALALIRKRIDWMMGPNEAVIFFGIQASILKGLEPTQQVQSPIVRCIAKHPCWGTCEQHRLY
jgi:hypothetical protein